MAIKSEFLKRPIEHVDITRESVVPIVEAMGQMAYSARDLHRARLEAETDRLRSALLTSISHDLYRTDWTNTRRLTFWPPSSMKPNG